MKKLNVTVSDFAHENLKNFIDNMGIVRGEKLNQDTAIEIILEGLLW